MPIYEYHCEDCGYTFSKLESITSENRIKTCPDCGGKAKRIVSVSSFHLKGGGWFSSGYSKEQPKSDKTNTKNKKSTSCTSCPAAVNS
jgi:putative FmdB family regulatory protein